VYHILGCRRQVLLDFVFQNHQHPLVKHFHLVRIEFWLSYTHDT
jgi:hypothetical protein